MFQGSMCALVTPFSGDGVDWARFAALVRAHVQAGTDVLVPGGTTGESATLSLAEHERVITECIAAADGRAPVLAGTGSNDTACAVELTRFAKAEGADGALVVAPYYNKPNQDGLYRHFATIADAADMPIVMYNIPGRSIVDINADTMAKLAQHPNIVGVKDATADLGRVDVYRELCGDDFVQLSGDDSSVLGYMAHGGHGCISVTANVAPAAMAQMMSLCLAGDFAAARAINQRLAPLHRSLFFAPSPGPAKYVLARLGQCSDHVRLPITAPDDQTRATLDAAVAHARLELTEGWSSHGQEG